MYSWHILFLCSLVTNVCPRNTCDDGEDCPSGYVCDHESSGACRERYPDTLLYADLGLGILFAIIILWCIKNLVEFTNNSKSSSNAAVPAVVPANSQGPTTVDTQATQAASKTEKDEFISTWYDVLLVFPFETTCKNYWVKLVALFGCYVSFFLGYYIPTCCDDYYDSDWDTQCCSWSGGNYVIWILSWIFFSWMIISGLYVIVVKRAEMTSASSSTTTTGNTETTTTTVSTSSSLGYNLFMFVLQMGTFTFGMVIVPVLVGYDCVYHYC